MTPIRRRTASASFTTSWPQMVAVPDVAGSSVVSIRMSVDLPAPFGPSSAKISPCSTEKEIPSTAVKSPKRFVIWSTSISLMENHFPASLYRQLDIRGHANGEAPIFIIDAQPDLECFDVPLCAAHIALRGEARIQSPVKNRAHAFITGRKPRFGRIVCLPGLIELLNRGHSLSR